jgi:hypothetical protein
LLIQIVSHSDGRVLTEKGLQVRGPDVASDGDAVRSDLVDAAMDQ